MPKYLVTANYTGDGAKGLAKDGGTKRRAAVTAAVAAVGGSIESFYYAFGDTDVFIVADVPDHIAAVALSLAVNGSGLVTARTIPLLTPEDIDNAVKKQVGYRAPGQ